jgi:hypothetical protein
MNPDEPERLSTVFARDLEVERPEDRWLIESLWGRQAVGLLGGGAKSLKSWLGLDLAVSVASGTPALDRFRVEAPGRALVYLAEDRHAQVRTRLEAICRHRRLEIAELDLAVITEAVVRLDTHRDQERLRATLEHLRPRLLLLDPLVRLHSCDENSSQDISRLLGYLRELQRTFDLALVLVHHTNKKSYAQPGHCLRGSSDLHAFGDSNAYLLRKGQCVLLTLEHRAAMAPEPMLLHLACLPDGTASHLELHGDLSTEDLEASLEARITRALRRQSPLPRTRLRSALQVNNQRLGEALCALERSGEIRRTPDGWALNVSANHVQSSITTNQEGNDHERESRTYP